MKTTLTIDSENIKDVLKSLKDCSTIDEYYANAKNGSIEFCSNSIGFLFFMAVFSARKEYKSTNQSYYITDFLTEETIKKENDFYQLYEPLFIAESIYPSIETANKENFKTAILGMHLGIIEYLFLTYRYLECLEYVADVLRIDSTNQTAQFYKGLCSESLLQYDYNMRQKSMVLIVDIYKSINPNDVAFDRNIVNNKINHYQKVNVSGWRTIGLFYTKATKKILDDFPLWNDEMTFYLTNKLFINPLTEVDCFVECMNEWIPIVGVTQEINDLFYSIVKEFQFCRRKFYQYDNSKDKDKLELVLVFNFMFSIFDKIGYLLYKYFDLGIKENRVFLHTIFNAKVNNTSTKLLEVKNQYLYSLYHISQEYSQSDSFFNPMNKISKAIKENRNLLTHRNTLFVNENTVYAVTSYLAKVVKRCIIYTNLILHIEECRKQLNLSLTDLIFYEYIGENLIRQTVIPDK